MTQNQPPKGYGTVDVQEKFNVPEFSIGLAGSDAITLRLDGDIFLFLELDDRSAIHFVSNKDDYEQIVTFTPTDEFWEALVTIDSVSGEIAKTRQTEYDGLLPQIKDYPAPRFPWLPKYEENLCFDAYYTVLRILDDSGWYYTSKDKYRQLFRRAHAEAKGEIPAYLSNEDPLDADGKFVPLKET